MCNFHVGQHVVCVVDVSVAASRAARRVLARGGTAHFPVKGKVYTIRDCFERNGVAIFLEEIRNAEIRGRRGWYEPAFREQYFRPLRKLTVEEFMSTEAPVDA